MAFSFTKFLKGLVIKEENTTTPKEIEIYPGGSAGTKTAITSSQTANVTLTLPDTTDTLVARSSVDTLTNKTIDAVSNTITNITDAEIAALAGIDAAKIGTGVVSTTEFNYLNGVTSNIQTQLNATVTETSTSTLTNKTIDADLNTITNIDNNDIKILAGIDAAKIHDGSVSNTEFGYLSGVTSDIQTQITGKQNSDATLTALAAFNTNGLVTQTAADTFVGRSIAVGSSKLSLTNGDGVSGNPTLDVSESNLTLNNIGGTLGISKGGTGQTTQTAAFDALSPVNTKGDLLVHNGTNNVRQAVGSNGTVLIADSTQSAGLRWGVGGILSVTSKTAAYTLTNSDDVVLASTSGGTFTLTLPAAASNTGKVFKIIKTDTSNNILTVDGNASETIFGQLSVVLSGQYDAIEIFSDGTGWLATTPEGHMRQVSVIITGSATTPGVTQERGAWVSSTNRSNIGTYGITIRTGIFSSAPLVTLKTIRNLDNDRYSFGEWLLTTPTTTAISFAFNVTDEQQALAAINQRDDNSNMCVVAYGPR